MTGDKVTLDGEDAEALFQRIEVIAKDTEAASQKLQLFVQQAGAVQQ